MRSIGGGDFDDEAARPIENGGMMIARDGSRQTMIGDSIEKKGTVLGLKRKRGKRGLS